MAERRSRWVVIVETDADGVGSSYGPFTRERAGQIGEFLRAQVTDDDHVWVQPLLAWTRAERSDWIAHRKDWESEDATWAGRHDAGGLYDSSS